MSRSTTTKSTKKTPEYTLTGVFALLILLCFPALGRMWDIDTRSLWITLGILAASLVAALILRRWKLSALPALVFCACLSYLSMQLLCRGDFTWFSDVGGPLHVFGACWILAIYLVLYALIGRVLPAVISGGALCLVFGVVDYTVQLFRGRPVLAIDITSISTALSVTESYEFSVTGLFVVGCVLAILSPLLIWSLLRGRERPKKAVNIALRVVSLAAACWYIYLCLNTSLVGGSGIHINWDENEFEDSAVMYFIVTAQKLNVEEPPGYSDEAVTEIMASVENDAPPSDARPNIIVVMNEAFSDLTQIGEFETNKPVTPFADSMRDETVHGYVYSSVFGGNTANSEYEFLTGDTMAFVPTGAAPYQLYINYETDSLISVLKAQGYETAAMHPYLASGWNRPQVYDLLGFDEVYFKDDFKNRGFLRNYVTDECNYDNVIRWFEEKSQSDAPQFFFNITMQNHGSYGFEGFEADVHILGHEGEFPLAEQYLSLLRITDEATREFIEYFEDVEEPTVILFFGDHQPNLDPGFYELLYGGHEGLTREETERKYATPFFIWSNLDIEPRDAGRSSMNYLASLLLEETGLQMSPYQSFLLQLSGEWPVINAQGAMDKAGAWHSLYDDVFTASESVNDYRILQYNHLMDPSGVRADVFGIDSD